MKIHSRYRRVLILSLSLALMGFGSLAARPGKACCPNDQAPGQCFTKGKGGGNGTCCQAGQQRGKGRFAKAGQRQGKGQRQASCATVQKTSDTPLTEAEASTLQLMREEEKLAHEVYVHLQDLYNDRPFANISGAESRHMGSLASLMEAYGVEDLSATEPGKYNNPDLQALYDQLVAIGTNSREAAYAVGVLVEETDIADLDKAIAETSNPDLIQVYTRLREGSYRHLRAFKSGLNRVSDNPEAVYIEAANTVGAIPTPPA